MDGVRVSETWSNGIPDWAAVITRPTAMEQRMIAAQLLEQKGKVMLKQWQARHIVLNLEIPQATTVRVSQWYFPGWRAKALGRNLIVHPTWPEGLIEIQVPAGKYELVLRLESLWPEKLGWSLALVGWVVILSGTGIDLWFSRRRTSLVRHCTATANAYPGR
jgi:hypothetical protein